MSDNKHGGPVLLRISGSSMVVKGKPCNVRRSSSGGYTFSGARAKSRVLASKFPRSVWRCLLQFKHGHSIGNDASQCLCIHKGGNSRLRVDNSRLVLHRLQKCFVHGVTCIPSRSR